MHDVCILKIFKVFIFYIVLSSFYTEAIAYEIGFAAGYYKPQLSDDKISVLGMTSSNDLGKNNMTKPDIFTLNITTSNIFSGVYSLNLIIGYLQLERGYHIEGIRSREDVIKMPSIEVFTGYNFKLQNLSVIPGVGVGGYFPFITITQRDHIWNLFVKDKRKDFNIGNLIGVKCRYKISKGFRINTYVMHRLLRFEHQENIDGNEVLMYKYDFNGMYILIGVNYEL